MHIMTVGVIKTFRRIWRRFIAKLEIKLIKPVLRERRPPEYTARDVGVGLFVAFTPTVGFQIPIVFALWATAKIVNKNLAFNPVLALAWTVFTSVFTIAVKSSSRTATPLWLSGVSWRSEFPSFPLFADRADYTNGSNY